MHGRRALMDFAMKVAPCIVLGDDMDPVLEMESKEVRDNRLSK